MNAKTYGVVFCISCACFVAGSIVGYATGQGRNTELENRFRELELSNKQLADQNRRASELVAANAKRHAIAKGIVDELNVDIANAGSTIDRAIRRVELIESALSVLLVDWEN